MQVTVSRLSPVEVEVKVLLPKEKVTTALSQAYATLGKNAQVPGFRRGKAPLPFLKKYYGPRVSAEVVGRLVDETLPQAIAQEKLEPVTQPSLTDAGVPNEGQDFTYTAKLEVRPVIEKITLDGIDVKRKVYTISDKDVDHQIEHLREQHVTVRVPDPARAAKAKDLVTIDYTVTIDGTARPDLAVTGRSVEIGGKFLLPEMDAGLQGMSVGEEKNITTKFSDEHSREDLRGKQAVFTVKVTEIREQVLPEVDDEFAKDVGSDSLAALKTKTREDLEKQGKDETEQQVREDAIMALVDANPITAPPSLVENAVSMIAREIAQMARLGGENFNPKEVLSEAQSSADKRVRAGILLHELARQNGLTVTDQDLEAKIEDMAKRSGKNAAKIRAENRDARKREALANGILEDKVIALLLSKVKITDVPADKPLHDHDHDH